MTRELDKNGKPKIYCKNCGKRMAYTYGQQYFGTTGYANYHYYQLVERNEVFATRHEAEAHLQLLTEAGHRWHGWSGNGDEPLKVDTMSRYNHPDEYYITYSERICDPVEFQFHSQSCMLEFMQRPEVIAQMLPVIEQYKAEPKVAKKKPRKKREVKIDLPDYEAMTKRLEGIL